MSKLKFDGNTIKELRRIKGRLALFATIFAIGGAPTAVGCTHVLPDGTVVTIDENQLPNIPIDDPEIIDTNDQNPEPEPEPDVVEPVQEEKTEPDIVLLDENGNYYVPQHVTLDDFYAKVEECEKNGYFATDWERDRFVGLALVYNSTSMDDEDIITIYKDYLTNYGYNTFKEQYSNFSGKIHDNTNAYPFSIYFIDPVLAEEAKAFEKYLDENGTVETEKLICEKLAPFDNYDCFKDNPLIFEELDIVGYMSSDLSKYYYACPAEYQSYNSRVSELMYASDEIDTREELIYKTSEYESSHQSFTK